MARQARFYQNPPLSCSECKQRNYNTMKNKKNTPTV